MEPLSFQVAERSNQRRSQRVLLNVPVVVLATGPDKKQISEETHTLVVNAHGALILLGLKVSIGQLLSVKNTKTGEEVSCRVAYLGSSQSGKAEVGIEFMKPSPRFWRVAFPPSDWSSKHPEAKGYKPPKPSPSQS